MVNKKFWLGILVIVLVFGMTVVGNLEAQSNSGGEFTLTNIPAKYNGKYAYIQSEDDNPFVVIGAENINSTSGRIVSSKITDGKVIIPLWITFDGKKFERYSGNHSVQILFIEIYDSPYDAGTGRDPLETIIFADLRDEDFKDKRNNSVKFTNGKATKSYNDRSIVSDAASSQTTTTTTTTSAASSQTTTQQSAGNMVLINGGTFTMGSPASEKGRKNDEVQHQVTVSGFYMSKYEVTQKEWYEVMRTTPHKGEGDNYPVYNVNWYDAVLYCNERSRKENLTPAYTINNRRVTNSGQDTYSVTWNRNANGYRLPTEAEWEYACRAGTTTAYNTGENINKDTTGWYSGNSGWKTYPVGSKPANAWGLYDMHGNVWEWCWNWYDKYPNGSQTDPVGPASEPSSMFGLSGRVFRGGCWENNEADIRSAKRNGIYEVNRLTTIGFRVVRSLGN
jgi:formylglycine-generating enzyme required for sulfatase activity